MSAVTQFSEEFMRFNLMSFHAAEESSLSVKKVSHAQRSLALTRKKVKRNMKKTSVFLDTLILKKEILTAKTLDFL